MVVNKAEKACRKKDLVLEYKRVNEYFNRFILFIDIW